MSDFVLTVDGDFDFSTGNLVLARDVNSVAKRKIIKTLQLFRGSWFLNTLVGIPWYQEVLGIKNIDLAVPRRIIENAIRGVENVASVSDLVLEYDNVTRGLSVSFEARLVDSSTVEGEITL